MGPDASLAPLTASDLYRFKWVSDVQLSLDGRRVAYVVTAPEELGKKNRSEIWVVETAPCAAGHLKGLPAGKRFTGGPRDRLPRWSPDGKLLAFVSDRGGENQIWLIPSDGGEANQITRHFGGVGEPVWSPDGQAIAFVASTGGDDRPLRPGGAAGDEKKSDVRAYTRLKYKANGKGLWDGKYAHVFVIPSAGGEPRQVTSGPYDDAGPAWSPDSQWLAFASNRSDNPDHAPVSDIWVVPAAGGQPRALTRSEGQASGPAWSPEGHSIAFYGHRNQFRGATDTHIHVVPADGTVEPADILQGWDGSAGVSVGSDMMASSTPPPHWSEDGVWVYFLATERGAADLYRARATASDGEGQPPRPERLTEDRHALYSVSLGRGAGAFAAARATFTNPGDVYMYTPAPGQAGYVGRRLTDLNPWLEQRAISEPEEMAYRGPDGDEVQGW
ncbi:MAG: hypothetical protein Q8P31_01205, partial [Bacillota bacterium]|nr:hypothetical protein [Bacillota bacterium]